jgi:hypothetical protein
LKRLFGGEEKLRWLAERWIEVVLGAVKAVGGGKVGFGGGYF